MPTSTFFSKKPSPSRCKLFASTSTFSGYNRSRGLAVTRRNKEPFDWGLQWYWTNGRGGRKYDPSLPGRYKTKRDAVAARRKILEERNKFNG